MLIRLAEDPPNPWAIRVGHRPLGPRVSPSFLGFANNDRAGWSMAFQHYTADRLQEACQVARRVGIGRDGELADATAIIDAEQVTSELSVITTINDWLEVECILTEAPIPIEEMGRMASEAIAYVFGEIGFRVETPVLVTILRKDATLPIHLQRGYASLKKPYAKYCIPSEAAESELALRKAVESLAACHAAGVISDQSAAPWLIAAAMAIGHAKASDQVRYRFCSGQWRWVSPTLLNARLQGLRLGEDQEGNAELAIDQARLLGGYLLKIGKPINLRESLSYHYPVGGVQYLRLIASRDPTRDVCKRIYGHAPEYLFEQALADTCKS